jgi:predicted metal-dependent peptidase
MEAKGALAMSKTTVAARKAKTLELLAQDRQKLLTKLPFTGSLVMRLDLVPVSDERLPTAATDGDRIFVDIDFYAKLTAEERLFVLAHEVWHCALLHFLRRGDRNQKLFNIAADLEIHFLLTDEGLKAPFVLPHDPNWKGLSAEEIYERLGKWKPQPCRGCHRGDTGEGRESEHIKGQGDGQGFDKHLEKNDDPGKAGNEERADGANKGRDPDYSPEIAPGAEERCRERLTAAVQQCERTKGTLPAGLKAVVEAVLRPEIGWRELLAQFVTSCYGGSRRWLPPARRHVHEGLYLQSMRSERLRAIVAIDTSGSTQGDLPKFFSELDALLGSFGSYELTVIQCDADIGSVEAFDDATPLDPDREWEATGGGGTDFRPVFSYIDEHPELDPNLLIFFTDGYGDYPDRAPAYPVMWLLTKDGECDVDWGMQVKFKE